MMSTTVETRYEHIVLDENGVAMIIGSRLKVADLVAEHVDWGWSAEEIAYQHPPLTLGQVYSALAYYWDHREQINDYRAQIAEEVEQLRQELPEFPRLAELRTRYRTQ
ncbi:DUF433 domain-containing protein [bacterium]|nr:DUF433 domain-containing protein [bacterium]